MTNVLLRWAVIGLVVPTVMVTGLGAHALVAGPTADPAPTSTSVSTPTPASSDTAAPSDTSTSTDTTTPTPTMPAPVTAPTTAPAPAPTATTPAPAPTAGSQGDTGADGLQQDPSLATMDKDGNHSMGSTIRANDPDAAPAMPQTRGLTLFAVKASAVPAGVPGLDVSAWQTLTASKWTSLYKQGARFAYVKATEGTDYTSSQFSEQYNDSYKAGFIRGAYHFAQPADSSGAAQATYFLKHGGGWKSDGRTLPPLLDIEYGPSGNTCYGLSKAKMIAWISSFSATIRAAIGRLPAIYTTTDWWTRCTGNTDAFAGSPLFIARYPASVSDGAGTLPNGWPHYTIWQWADSGAFPGDQDVFNGSTAQLTTFATQGDGANPLPTAIIGTGDLNGDGHPDFIAREPDGSLWFYAGTGTVSSSDEGYRRRVKIATGWGVYDDIIGVGDFNGDGHPDVMARKPDGTIWFFAGTGHATLGGTFAAPQKIGTQWQQYREIIAAGDLDGDGHPDLLAVKPDGTLWFYHGTGTVSGSNEGYTPKVEVGHGWDTYSRILGVGDLDGDGHDDLVGVRSNGSVWFYAGTGNILAHHPGHHTQIATLATGTNAVTAVGDLSGDGLPDLIERTTNGRLYLTRGVAKMSEGYEKAQRIGTGGWNAYSQVIGVRDFDGDHRNDVIAVRPDGTLWFYHGTGTVGSGSVVTGSKDGYSSKQKIGHGWNMYTMLIGGGDFTGDGKADLIGRKSDGTLWLYRGTGSIHVSQGYQRREKIGKGGWNAYTSVQEGDFNHDGHIDLLAERSDGSLWFYYGTRKGEGYKARVQVAGINLAPYSRWVSVGDITGDGLDDLIAVDSSGALWLYPGAAYSSSTGVHFGPRIKIGTGGWSAFSSIVATGDFSGDGVNDFIGVHGANLRFYRGTGDAGQNVGALSGPGKIGTGWDIFG